MICESCYSERATEKHHMFSQTKANRQRYGKLLDDRRNLQMLCYDCHHNKAVKKLTEYEFCQILGIEPRGKVEKGKQR